MKPNEKKFDVLTIFDACVDLIVELGDTVPEFDQKEKLFDDFGLYMGGSACLFASQCAKLGLKTTGAGVVGKDSFGKLVSETLKKCGVNTDYLSERDGIKTSIGISLNKGADRAILTYDQSILAADLSLITDEMLMQTRHLHIASYYLLKKLQPDIPLLLKRAKKYGLTTSLDTNWDPDEKWILDTEILKLIDVFLPNENEIKLLSKTDDLEAAIAFFREYVPITALKLGARGAVAVTKSERVMLPAPHVRVMDTIGAGDSFDGGFLYGYLNGCSLEKSLEYGIICGSHNVSQRGGYDGQAKLQALLEAEKTGGQLNFTMRQTKDEPN